MDKMGTKWIPTLNFSSDPKSTRRDECNEPIHVAIRALHHTAQVSNRHFQLSSEATRGVLPADLGFSTTEPQMLTMRPRREIHVRIEWDHFRDHPSNGSLAIVDLVVSEGPPNLLFGSFRAHISSENTCEVSCRREITRRSHRNKQNENPSSTSRDIPEIKKLESDLVIFTRLLKKYLEVCINKIISTWTSPVVTHPSTNQA